jgi:hypothetical protein
MARVICSRFPVIINIILYKKVFRVTFHAWPEIKKNLKFSKPFQGLPKIPRL